MRDTTVPHHGPTLPVASAHRPQYTTSIGSRAIGGVIRMGDRENDRRYHGRPPWLAAGWWGTGSSGPTRSTNNSNRTAPAGLGPTLLSNWQNVSSCIGAAPLPLCSARLNRSAGGSCGTVRAFFFPASSHMPASIRTETSVVSLARTRAIARLYSRSAAARASSFSRVASCERLGLRVFCTAADSRAAAADSSCASGPDNENRAGSSLTLSAKDLNFEANAPSPRGIKRLLMVSLPVIGIAA